MAISQAVSGNNILEKTNEIITEVNNMSDVAEDSGWVTLSLYPDWGLDFNSALRYRIKNGVVNIRGVIYPPSTNNLGSDFQTVICDLPQSLIPNGDVGTIHQGGNLATWFSRIEQGNNKLYATLYRIGANYSTPDPLQKMTINITYTI